MFSLAVRAVRFINLLLTSLIAGMSFARVLNPSVTRLPSRVRIEYQQALDHTTWRPLWASWGRSWF